VSAILIYNTLQTTSPFTDVVILHAVAVRATPAQSPASTNVVKLPAVICSLLKGRQLAEFSRFKSELLGVHVRLNKGDILKPQVRDSVQRIVLASDVAPSSLLCFH